MNTPRRFRSLLIGSLFLVVVPGGLIWLTVRQAQYRSQLNRRLIRAILNYDTDTAIALLQAGADPNTHEQPDAVIPFWQQLRDRFMHHKPPVNKSDTALLLIMDSLVDRLQKALTDNTIPRENARLVAALLDRGAEINAVNSIHDTALQQAAGWDYTDTVRILLSHGADPNIADVGDNTPLMEAAVRGNAEVVRLLLEREANPNAQDLIGDTALMEAAHIEPQEAAVAVLLKYHPKLDLKNRKGETALAIARQWHDPNIIHMLQQAGARK